MPLIPAAALNAPGPTGPVHNGILPYGFDIVPQARAGIQHIEPFFNTPPAPAGVKKCRANWQPEHTAHLFYLLETAMRTLNRKLKHGDFKAITEALHRQFRGTMFGNVAYTERGYNAVHSYMVKTRRLDLLALEERLFPVTSAPIENAHTTSTLTHRTV